MIKGATIKLTKRQALENMRKPIPNETKGDPDTHKKWIELWYKDSLVNQINKLEPSDLEDNENYYGCSSCCSNGYSSGHSSEFYDAKEKIIKLIWKE